MDYALEISNKHFLVTINHKKYLLDTGSPNSFMMSDYSDHVIINVKDYTLVPKNFSNQAAEDSFNIVKTRFDGIIGLDIIKETSLTISVKDMEVDFKPHNIDGEIVPFTSYGYPIIRSSVGPFIVDTGAVYAFGTRALLINLRETSRKARDFNPHLGHLVSPLFTLNVTIGKKSRDIEICYNNTVETRVLSPLRSTAIGSIIDYFDEACVFDMTKNLLILK